MTGYRATILFLCGILLGVMLVWVCSCAPTPSASADPVASNTVPAPFYALDRFEVIALADTLALCRKTGIGANGKLNVECVPIPAGSFLLVPRDVPSGQKAD